MHKYVVLMHICLCAYVCVYVNMCVNVHMSVCACVCMEFVTWAFKGVSFLKTTQVHT